MLRGSRGAGSIRTSHTCRGVCRRRGRRRRRSEGRRGRRRRQGCVRSSLHHGAMTPHRWCRSVVGMGSIAWRAWRQPKSGISMRYRRTALPRGCHCNCTCTSTGTGTSTGTRACRLFWVLVDVERRGRIGSPGSRSRGPSHLHTPERRRVCSGAWLHGRLGTPTVDRVAVEPPPGSHRQRV